MPKLTRMVFYSNRACAENWTRWPADGPILPYFPLTRVFSVSGGSKENLNLLFWGILHILLTWKPRSFCFF